MAIFFSSITLTGCISFGSGSSKCDIVVDTPANPIDAFNKAELIAFATRGDFKPTETDLEIIALNSLKSAQQTNKSYVDVGSIMYEIGRLSNLRVSTSQVASKLMGSATRNLFDLNLSQANKDICDYQRKLTN